MSLPSTVNHAVENVRGRSCRPISDLDTPTPRRARTSLRHMRQDYVEVCTSTISNTFEDFDVLSVSGGSPRFANNIEGFR